MGLVAVCAALAACGTKQAASKEAAATPTPSPAPRAKITVAETHTIKLGTTKRDFVERFGPAPTPIRYAGRGERCGYYDLPKKNPAQIQWKVCFRNGRLALFSTFIPTIGTIGPAGGGSGEQ